MNRFSLLATAVLATAGLSSAAAAADAASRTSLVLDPTPIASDEWIVTLKGTIGVSPTWMGSDRYSAFGYPSVGYRKLGEKARFTSPDDSASLELYDTSWLRTGVVVAYQSGLYSGQQAQLFGLRDRGWSVQPGFFVDLWPTDYLRARLEGRYAVGNVHGIVGKVGLDLVLPWQAFTFAVGPRLTFGSNQFVSDIYSVRPYEAQLNGLIAPYDAKGGVTSLGAVGSVSYTWSEAWTTTVYGGYSRLTSSAGNSPIVRVLGDRDQFSAGFTAAYSFRMKALW